MSLFQAVVIALGYAFARSAACAGLGNQVLSQPLFAGAFAGLVIGQPLAGAALGGVLNLASLAISTSQKPLPPSADVGLIGYVGVPLLLISGIKTGSVAGLGLLAALAGFGLILTFVRGLFNTVLVHWVDVAVERSSPVTVMKVALVASQGWLFVTTFFPVVALLRLDIQSLIVLQPPANLSSILIFVEQALAAFGLALLLKDVVRGSGLAYFALGWLLTGLAREVVTASFSVLAVGACVAVIHTYIARRRAIDEQSTHIRESAGPGSATPEIPAAMLNRAWLTWLFTADALGNFERFKNLAFGMAMAPLGERLYPSPEPRRLYMVRNLRLLETEPVIGAATIGAALAAERIMYSAPAAVSVDELGSARTALMTIGAALGDPMMRIILSINVAIGAALANQDNFLGPVLFGGLQGTLIWALSYASFNLGYAQARTHYGAARLADWLSAGMFALSRIGAFAIGMLIVRLAPLHFDGATSVRMDDALIPLASTLDQIAPNLLAMMVVAGLAWVMARRNR